MIGEKSTISGRTHHVRLFSDISANYGNFISAPKCAMRGYIAFDHLAEKVEASISGSLYFGGTSSGAGGGRVVRPWRRAR